MRIASKGRHLRVRFGNPRGMFAESVAYGFALDIQRRLGLLAAMGRCFYRAERFPRSHAVRAGLPERRVHVIPHGVPILTHSPGRGRYALYAGRLSAEKGVRTLLRARH